MTYANTNDKASRERSVCWPFLQETSGDLFYQGSPSVTLNDVEAIRKFNGEFLRRIEPCLSLSRFNDETKMYELHSVSNGVSQCFYMPRASFKTFCQVPCCCLMRVF